MPTFKDNAGREWSVAIDVYLIEQVETHTQVKIARLLEDKAAGLIDLLGDPVRLVRVLWVLIEEQAVKLKVEPEHFGRAMGGDALENAAKCFLEAFANFTSSHQRKIIKALMAQGERVADAQTAAALKRVEEATATLSGSAMSLAESSESIPCPAG
jgi:hypothetical protein